MESKHLHLGYRLKKQRTLNGYSIRGAAKKIQVCPTRLSHWERGLRKPSIQALIKLAVLYRVLIDELCFDLRKSTVKEFESVPTKPDVIIHKIIKEKPT